MRKYILKLFFTTLVVGGNAMHVLAQLSGSYTTARASATIITPIKIIKNVDMNFGTMAVSSSTPGSVVLSPAGTRSAAGAGGVTLPASIGTVSAASFTISGQGGYTYSITLPTSCNIIDASGDIIIGSAFISDPASLGILGSSGDQVLNVGATLNLIAGQHTGTYTSNTGLPVTVNYN